MAVSSSRANGDVEFRSLRECDDDARVPLFQFRCDCMHPCQNAVIVTVGSDYDV